MFNFGEYINYPLPLQDVLLRLFDKNDNLVIVEAGCCECEDSVKYAKLFQNATIIAFEPIEKNFKLCEYHLEKYAMKKRIALFDYALSDKISKEYMYVSEGMPDNIKPTKEWRFGNKFSSLLKPNIILDLHKWCKFTKQQQVKTTYLDWLFEMKKIKKIDLLHLSVQGSELSVLKGLKNNLKNTKVIFTKISMIELYKQQSLVNDIERFLNNNNFELCVKRADETQGDELWVNKDYLK
jgi:FkbM family methyltransferase